jgi:hypothetical protein
MAGTDLRFYYRNLPAATRDSCGILPALKRHVCKRSSVSIKHRRSTRILLESLANAISVSGVNLHKTGFPAPSFGSDQGATGAAEQVGD